MIENDYGVLFITAARCDVQPTPNGFRQACEYRDIYRKMPDVSLVALVYRQPDGAYWKFVLGTDEQQFLNTNIDGLECPIEVEPTR